MTVYLVNIFLLALWAIVILYNKKIVNGKKIFIIVATLQWIALSGLRHISIGADTYNYSNSFYRTLKTPWEIIIDNSINILFFGMEGKDPGYSIYEKTIQVFTNSYQVHLLSIAILFTVSLGYWIYDNSKDSFMSFLVYSILFYAFFSITGHRQTIATALTVLIGYGYIKKRKFLPFAILVLISFTIHKSAIVFLPFYFVANKKITKKYIITIIILIGSLYLYRFEFSKIMKQIGGYEIYGVNESAGAPVFTAMLIMVTLAVLWRKNKIIAQTNTIHHYNALIMALIFTPLTFVNPSAMRVVQYYSIFIILVIPEIIHSFSKKEKTIVYYTVICIALLLFFRTNPNYMFFWN